MADSWMKMNKQLEDLSRLERKVWLVVPPLLMMLSQFSSRCLRSNFFNNLENGQYGTRTELEKEISYYERAGKI